MEKNGFSGAEVIFDGKNGFNLKDIKSSLNLSLLEQQMNFRSMMYELSQINERLVDELTDCSIIMTISYSNIHVKIIDKLMLLDDKETGMISSTDTNVLELSSVLKDYSAQTSSMSCIA